MKRQVNAAPSIDPISVADPEKLRRSRSLDCCKMIRSMSRSIRGCLPRRGRLELHTIGRRFLMLEIVAAPREPGEYRRGPSLSGVQSRVEVPVEKVGALAGGGEGAACRSGNKLVGRSNGSEAAGFGAGGAGAAVRTNTWPQWVHLVRLPSSSRLIVNTVAQFGHGTSTSIRNSPGETESSRALTLYCRIWIATIIHVQS